MNQKKRQAAIVALQAYPNAKSVWVTPDAQVFLHEQRAKMHSSDAVEVKRSEIEELAPAPEAAAEQKEYAENVKTVVAKVKEMTDKAQLEALKADDTRKTVQDAIAKRLTELEAATAPNEPTGGSEPATGDNGDTKTEE